MPQHTLQFLFNPKYKTCAELAEVSKIPVNFQPSERLHHQPEQRKVRNIPDFIKR